MVYIWYVHRQMYCRIVVFTWQPSDHMLCISLPHPILIPMEILVMYPLLYAWLCVNQISIAIDR